MITPFGVGAWAATQFKLAANGRGSSAGWTVKKLDEVGFTIVTLSDTPVAVAGMTQFPLAPRTIAVYVSFGPSALARGPTLSAPARVSINRHGVIGTNDDGVAGVAAEDVSPPPKIATTTPTTTQRLRATADPAPQSHSA